MCFISFYILNNYCQILHWICSYILLFITRIETRSKYYHETQSKITFQSGFCRTTEPVFNLKEMSFDQLQFRKLDQPHDGTGLRSAYVMQCVSGFSTAFTG